MKKILCLLIIFLLMGCSNNKLTCTKSIEESGLSVEEKITINFRDEIMDIVDLNINSKAKGDIIKDNWTLFVETVDSQYKNNSQEGIDIRTESDFDNYSHDIFLKIDMEKVNVEDLEKYELEEFFDLRDSSYNEIKNSLIIDGYTCK